MKQSRRIPLQIGKSVVIGLQIGAIIVGLSAVAALTGMGFQTYQARTGSPGGELFILPAFALLFYCGWVAGREKEAKRYDERRKVKRDKD